MTSNVGAESISNKTSIGFVHVEGDEKNEEKKQESIDVAKKHFKPEFINRIDDIVSFNSLTRNDIKEIVKLLFNDYITRIKHEHEITLTLDKTAVEYFADNGYDEKYGVRELKRVMKRDFETLFAEQLLTGVFKTKKSATLQYKRKKLTIKLTQ